MSRLLLAILMFGALSGCASGREHNYDTIRPHVLAAAPGAAPVALAVQDQRAEVVSLAKKPDFVGLSRGGYGNPFDVTTASDAPLATDLTGAIAAALSAANYRVQTVIVTPGSDLGPTQAKLAETGAHRLMLLVIRELKSDTYQTTALNFQLELLVLDERKEVLARKQLSGRDNLGGSAWNPGGHADKVVPVAVRLKLEQLLDDPEIARALQEKPGAEGARAKPNS